MGIATIVLLLVAGVVAGTIGTAGGIASLVSYPALLLAGLDPLSADVVNIVAFLACWPGSMLTSRRELREVRSHLRFGLPIAAVGAVVGAVLLLTTPVAAFSSIVPFLVLVGGAALALGPWLVGDAQPGPGHRPAAGPLLAAVAVYAGYFGAGAGVLILAVLLGSVDGRLPEANALKNTLIGATALASTVVLAAGAPVVWSAVLPLACGLFAGSTLGPLVARRVPARVVRVAVALLSVVLAVQLWFDAG